MSTDHDLIIIGGDNAEGITYFEARYASGGKSLMVAGRIEFRKRIRVGVHIIRSRKIRSSGLAGLVFRE